jgi:hypothetical protein
MLPPLFARPPANPTEERRIRRLAAARHAPASWLQRARIITLSWDGAQVGQIAVQLGCHPRTVYRWCTASTRAASTTSATSPARVGPGGCRSWSAAGSLPWSQATRPADSASPTAAWPPTPAAPTQLSERLVEVDDEEGGGFPRYELRAPGQGAGVEPVTSTNAIVGEVA